MFKEHSMVRVQRHHWSESTNWPLCWPAGVRAGDANTYKNQRSELVFLGGDPCAFFPPKVRKNFSLGPNWSRLVWHQVSGDKAPRLSTRIVFLILSSDTSLFGDDLYCICFEHPNRETAMLSRSAVWLKVTVTWIWGVPIRHCPFAQMPICPNAQHTF